MARRIYITSQGMKISKPGFDAATASEDNLLFSTTRKQFMVSESGVINSVPSTGVTVNFAKTYTIKPLVYVGDIEGNVVTYPFTYIVNLTNFGVSPSILPNGTYPATNRPAIWFAFVRNLTNG
jgi:hypothetical protein